MKARWLVAVALAGALGFAACGDDDLAGSGGDDDDGGGNAAVMATSSAGGLPQVPATGSNAETSTGAGDEPLPVLDPTRKIIFTASLALRADDVSRTYSSAVDLARSNGGYVEKSQFTNDRDDSSRQTASLTIRVPVHNYDALLGSLRGIQGASVDTEGSNSAEVTEQYTDLESRLRNLERTEGQYLDLMAQAKTIQEILTVQDRLATVRSQIEQIQGRLNVLDAQTAFATVNVSIAPVFARPETKPADRWTLKDVAVGSWEWSLEAARYVAAAVVIATVAGAWLVLPLGVVFFGMRRLRRRPGDVAST